MAVQSSPRKQRAQAKTRSALQPAADCAAPLPPTTSRRELLDSNGISDRRFRQFLYDFSTLGAHIDVVRAHLASLAGLSSPQYNCAMTIAYYQRELGVSVSDVAKYLHVSTAFVTSEAGKLEKAGIIAKHHNPNDGRGILLRLTRQGEKVLRDLGPHRRAVNDSLFQALSAQDFRHLARVTASLIGDFTATVQMLKMLESSPNRTFPSALLFEAGYAGEPRVPQ